MAQYIGGGPSGVNPSGDISGVGSSPSQKDTFGALSRTLMDAIFQLVPSQCTPKSEIVTATNKAWGRIDVLYNMIVSNLSISQNLTPAQKPIFEKIKDGFNSIMTNFNSLSSNIYNGISYTKGDVLHVQKIASELGADVEQLHLTPNQYFSGISNGVNYLGSLTNAGDSIGVLESIEGAVYGVLTLNINVDNLHENSKISLELRFLLDTVGLTISTFPNNQNEFSQISKIADNICTNLAPYCS